MCWRLRYETTHQEQWCSHTVSTAETSCGQDRVLWDFDYKVRGDSGIRINRLKPLFTDIRCDVKQEGDRKNVNIPRYDVDNVTTKCVHTKLSSQNSKHQTDSVEHRLANLFANGSALASVHFGELELWLWSWLRSPLWCGWFHGLITTPNQVIGCGFACIEDGKVTECRWHSSRSAKT